MTLKVHFSFVLAHAKFYKVLDSTYYCKYALFKRMKKWWQKYAMQTLTKTLLIGFIKKAI